MINFFFEFLYFLLNYLFTYTRISYLKESLKRRCILRIITRYVNRASSCNIIYVFKNIFVIQIYFYIVTIIRKSWFGRKEREEGKEVKVWQSITFFFCGTINFYTNIYCISRIHLWIFIIIFTYKLRFFYRINRWWNKKTLCSIGDVIYYITSQL